MDIPQPKTCTRCKEGKPRSSFHKNRSTKDGLATRCKPCEAKVRRELRRRKKGQEAQTLYRAEWESTGQRQCTKCKLVKPVEAFYWNNDHDLPRSRCKRCYAAEYQKAKERKQLTERGRWIRKKYGLSVEAYEEIVARPCAICFTTETPRVLDHDHATGKNRDALCDLCNTALGAFREDTEFLKSAFFYLQRHGE